MTSRGSDKSASQSSNPALSKPAYTPIAANSSVLIAGLMGLRPNNNPAISSQFTSGQSNGLGRRPSLQRRTLIGGQ